MGDYNLNEALKLLGNFHKEQTSYLKTAPDPSEKNRLINNLYDIQLAIAEIEKVLNRCS